MGNSTRKPSWQLWSNILSFFGAAGCIVVLLWSFGLIGYYSSNRPPEPMPERGWTQKLSGTKGYYGSYAENEQLLRLHEWFYPFFLMAGVGAWIKTLHKKNEPWAK